MSLVIIRKKTYSLNYFLHGADSYWKFLLKQQEQKWDHLFIVLQLLSCVQLFATPWTAAQQVSLSSTSSNSCPLNQWCHPTISSSVVPFSSCLQSFPESGSFPMSQFFSSSGQNIGASASASIFPMNMQGWFLLGLTSFQSKGLPRVFSSTTIQKDQLFGLKMSIDKQRIHELTIHFMTMICAHNRR